MKNRIGTRMITVLLIMIAAGFYLKYLGVFQQYENVELPEGLHPIVAERTNQLIQQAETAGIRILITDDFRSFEDQNGLYAKGRTTEGRIVTNAAGGESYHNYGLAVDFALLNKNGEAIWDMEYDGNQNGNSDWMEVVDLAKNLGFKWGGDWLHFKDYPHLQMDFGLSIHELQRGKRPPVPTLNASET